MTKRAAISSAAMTFRNGVRSATGTALRSASAQPCSCLWSTSSSTYGFYEQLGRSLMLMPVSMWRIHGGLRPWIGKHWSFVIKTGRWGELDVDWFTDADKVYEFGPFALFYHRAKVA